MAAETDPAGTHRSALSSASISHLTAEGPVPLDQVVDEIAGGGSGDGEAIANLTERLTEIEREFDLFNRAWGNQMPGLMEQAGKVPGLESEIADLKSRVAALETAGE